MNLEDLVKLQEHINVHRKEVADGVVSVEDGIYLPVEFKIERYASEQDYLDNNPYLVTRDGKVLFGDGLVTNVGSAYLWMRANISSGTLFNDTNSFLAIGSSTTAAAVGDVALVSQTGNRKGMDTGFPKWGTAAQNATNPIGAGNEQKMQWKATFGSSDGNSDWREFGIFNASTGGGASPTGTVLLDRFISTQGTKVSGQVWALTILLTLA